MKKGVSLLLGLFLLVALPTSVVSQETVPPTVEISGIAYGFINGLQHDCPVNPNGRIDGYVGMIVECQMWAIDDEGGFTPSSISAIPADPTRVTVTVGPIKQDSLGTYLPTDVRIQVIRRGNWQVEFTSLPIIFTMAYGFNRAPDAVWSRFEFPPLNILEDETVGLCAYQGGYGENAIAKSVAVPECPDFGTPLPQFEVVWQVPSNILELVGPTQAHAIALGTGTVLVNGSSELIAQLGPSELPRVVEVTAVSAPIQNQ